MLGFKIAFTAIILLIVFAATLALWADAENNKHMLGIGMYIVGSILVIAGGLIGGLRGI